MNAARTRETSVFGRASSWIKQEWSLRFALVGAAILVILVAPALFGMYTGATLSRMLIFIGLTLSWYIIGGLAGQLHLGQAAFFGLGCYIAGWSMGHLGPNPFMALGVAFVATGASAVVMFPLFRTYHAFFAIGSLAVVFILAEVASRFFEGGRTGFFFPAVPLSTNWFMMAALIAAVLICAGVILLLDHSRFGRKLRAIRADHVTAHLAGVNVFAIKARVLTLSAAFGGLFGAFYAIDLGYTDPGTAFDLERSVLPMLAALFGGIGSVLGPVLGAFAVATLDELSRDLLQSAWASLVIEGILFILIARWAPRGLIGLLTVKKDVRTADPFAEDAGRDEGIDVADPDTMGDVEDDAVRVVRND